MVSLVLASVSYYFCYFLLLPQVILLLPLKLLITISVLLFLRQFEQVRNRHFFFICLAETMTSNCCRNQTLFVCKEATNRDTSLKKQLLLSTENKQKVKTEKNSNRGSFFEDQTTDFTIAEVNFPENILVYANQGSATPPPPPVTSKLY